MVGVDMILAVVVTTGDLHHWSCTCDIDDDLARVVLERSDIRIYTVHDGRLDFCI